MSNSPPRVSRRGMFKLVLQEATAMVGRASGEQIYSLRDLEQLPEALLGQIIPMLNPEFQVQLEEDHVWSRNIQTGQMRREFPLTPENTVPFNFMNGENTLAQVGQLTAAQLGWDEARGLARARELFLAMAQHLFFIPRGPLPPPD